VEVRRCGCHEPPILLAIVVLHDHDGRFEGNGLKLGKPPLGQLKSGNDGVARRRCRHRHPTVGARRNGTEVSQRTAAIGSAF
jgi:hypothetical protein